MKKKILWCGLSLLLVAALVLTSCAKEVPGEQEEEEEEEEEPVLRIGFISRLAVPWWIIAGEGLNAAARDFGFEPIIYHPPQLTVEDQVSVMETWIAMGIDGIMIGPNEPGPMVGVINQAIDAGIPVITINSDSPDSKRLLMIGYTAPDMGITLAEGQLAMMKLAGHTPPGKVTYHADALLADFSVEIWEAWVETIEAAGYEAVEAIMDGGDAALSLSGAATAIALYPDLEGMTAINDYTGPAVAKAVTNAGKIDVLPVQGNGIIGEQVVYMETGALDATTDLLQYEHCYLAAEIIYKLLQVGRENWDDILKEYQPGYPAVTKLVEKFGWITAQEVDVEMWPELKWIMTVDEWKKAYPEVWDIIR